MANMTFVEHDGTEHAVTIEEGKSLMQIAMDNAVPGIDADCGGSCACGTCHVIVDPDWIGMTGEVGSDEKQLLNMTPDKTTTSRLACQITASDALDGMIVRLPEFQM